MILIPTGTDFIFRFIELQELSIPISNIKVVGQQESSLTHVAFISMFFVRKHLVLITDFDYAYSEVGLSVLR